MKNASGSNDSRMHGRKILVIDEDASTADTIAMFFAEEVCEVIACRDMALAEVATDLAEFDIIFVAPSSTGFDGAAGLAAADFLVARNPRALTVVLVPEADADLKAAIERAGTHRVLTKPLRQEELVHIAALLGPACAAEVASARRRPDLPIRHVA